MSKRIKRGTKNRFARRKAARRQKIIAWCIVIIIPLMTAFGGIFIGSKATMYAQSNTKNDYGRQITYTAYTVRSGDTIWGIASDLSALNPEFNDIRQYVAEIKRANGLTTSEIKYGETILIPYYISPEGKISHDEIYSKYGIGE